MLHRSNIKGLSPTPKFGVPGDRVNILRREVSLHPVRWRRQQLDILHKEPKGRCNLVG
jgi:hypothetical protein